MSKATIKTESLADKYEGVIDRTFSHQDPMGLVLPSSMSKLKEHYNELSNYIEKGMLEKVGLTDKGYVVYKNKTTDRLVYYYIVIRHNEITIGKYWGRDERDLEPHSGFGDHWVIRP